MPYVLARNGRPYGEPKGLTATLRWVSTATKHVGPRYRVGSLDAVGHPRFLLQLAARLKTRDEGETTHVYAGVENRKRPVEFLVKKVRPTQPLLSYTGSEVNMASANDRMQEIGNFLATNYQHIRCNGWLYTRPVAGSTTPSQHSAWPPQGQSNAGDFAAYRDDTPSKGVDTEYLGNAFEGLLRAAKRDEVLAWRIIWQDKDYRWDRDFEPIPYGGNKHTSHFHVEARPVQTGEPIGWRG